MNSRINQVTKAVVAVSPVPVAVSKVIAIYVAASEKQDKQEMYHLYKNVMDILNFSEQWLELTLNIQFNVPPLICRIALGNTAKNEWAACRKCNPHTHLYKFVQYYNSMVPVLKEVQRVITEYENDNIAIQFFGYIPRLKSIAAPEIN